jgi:hypothetical protein
LERRASSWSVCLLKGLLPRNCRYEMCGELNNSIPCKSSWLLLEFVETLIKELGVSLHVWTVCFPRLLLLGNTCKFFVLTCVKSSIIEVLEKRLYLTRRLSLERVGVSDHRAISSGGCRAPMEVRSIKNFLDLLGGDRSTVLGRCMVQVHCFFEHANGNSV